MATETKPQDHILVRTIEQVLEGTADAKALEPVVKESEASFQEFVNGFRRTVAELPEETRAACEELIEGSEELFRQFESGLVLVRNFLTDRLQENLVSAGNLFSRVTSQVNAVQLELRNRALSLMGPTSIPNLNLILRAYENFKLGKDSDGILLELVEAEIFNASASIEQLGRSKQTDAVQSIRGAYSKHRDCMQLLGKAVSEKNINAAATEIQKCKDTFEEIRSKIGAAAASLRTDGPTESADANLVLSISDDVRLGALPSDALMEPLAAYRADAATMKAELTKMADQQATSVLVTEEIDRALEAMDLQDEAFEDFDLFFEHRDVILLERANQRLQRAVEALWLCLKELQEIADREGKTLCIKCSHYNPQNRSRCEQCGFNLPNMARDQSTTTFETGEGQSSGLPQQDEPVVTSNLVRIYKAVDAVYEGKISKDDFLAEIAWFEKLLDSNQEYEVDEPDVSKMNSEERAQAEAAFKALAEVEEAFRAAHDEMGGACASFRRYLESEEKADLEEGVKLMDAGARKMASVRAVAVAK